MIDHEKIREVLRQAGLDVDPSPEDFSKPFNIIGLDSLDVYNLLSEVEVMLDKAITDSDFENINTLDELISFLNS